LEAGAARLEVGDERIAVVAREPQRADDDPASAVPTEPPASVASCAYATTGRPSTRPSAAVTPTGRSLGGVRNRRIDPASKSSSSLATGPNDVATSV
jgi:hypothetical protein